MDGKEYCIYLRKSRADMDAEAHGEGETLARHEKALLELAKRERLNITQIHREIVSGDTIAARPVMQQLLQEVQAGQWAGVLVMEVERLARGETIDQGIVAQSFQYSGLKGIRPVVHSRLAHVMQQAQDRHGFVLLLAKTARPVFENVAGCDLPQAFVYVQAMDHQAARLCQVLTGGGRGREKVRFPLQPVQQGRRTFSANVYAIFNDKISLGTLMNTATEWAGAQVFSSPLSLKM